MRPHRSQVIPLVAGLGLLLSLAVSRLSPAAPRTGSAGAGASDSLADGPHVYWRDARRAIVFYLCRDSVTALRVEGRDTVAFQGSCADSGAAYHLPSRPPRPARDTWSGVSRILAVSDIHGEHQALVTFLERAGVIDAAGHWAWGTGHLVVLGDVFDRGAAVTECLWLVYRLEQEAQAAGGHVHFVLGNHEVMVMRDDLRYVNAKYTDGIVRYSGIRYHDLFGPDTELGRWLRSKPLVLRINDILFVHAGLSPAVVARGLDLATLNAVGRQSLDLSSVALAFSDLPALLFGSTGPLWYRGYFPVGAGAISTAAVDSVLAFYRAGALVVGHTDIPQVTRLHEGRVYGIDVALEQLGSLQGLLWENGAFQVVTGTGQRQPPQ